MKIPGQLSVQINSLTAITYPSGRVVSFLRNNVGQVSSVLMKPPGAAAGQYLATSLRWSTMSGNLLGLIAYSYTPTGDRAREVATPLTGRAVTTTLTYPATSNRLSTLTPDNGVPGRSYTYDAAGNLLSQRSGTFSLAFTYSVRNRPVTATSTGSGSVIQTSRYQYNALEQLVSRSTTALGGPKGTVHYIYALDGTLLAEADGATGQIQREYVWLPDEGGAPPMPLALITGVNTATPSLLMVHADHLNRPIRLTDAARATVWQASYRPFGEVESIQGKLEQNLRFPGQYFLMETGLSYNWHRFYDPATGRYTQPDPLRFVDGPSVYGYAGASPLMWVDPDGRNPLAIPAAICIENPGLCAATVIVIYRLVWDGCVWMLKRYIVGSGDPNIPPISLDSNGPPISPREPPADAWDPNGAKAPGYPGDTSPDRPGGYPGGTPGYEDPKGGPDWVRAPNGKGWGWKSKDGKVWVPSGPDGKSTGKGHGGPHWDVQGDGKGKDKDYENIYPGGRRR